LKKTMLLTLGLGLLIALTACENGKNSAKAVVDSSVIEVKAGNQSINPIVVSKIAEKSGDGNSAPFQSSLKDKAVNLPYVKLGESIQVTFHAKTTEPGSYELLDYVLTEEGGVKYEKTEPTRAKMEFDKGTGSFTLKENMLIYASSNSKDYEPGAVLRGFRLLCEWDHEIQEVAFVTRTDAIPEEGQ